jgi:Flp pilus assembly pilin Flp
MRTAQKRFLAFLADESASEVLEYALILGLISVAVIAAASVIGTKVLARWNSISGSSL